MAILPFLTLTLSILLGLLIRQLAIIIRDRRAHGGLYLSWLAFIELNDREFDEAMVALHHALRGAETAQQQEVRRA